ncbi:MAG: homoserine dehydrogenase [Ruminococcaceae bacterium]|nr:homoserine dehydrogenase [Oscillospiraceae bacterium]
MKHIAIIGYGVVGGGITAVIEENKAFIERMVGDCVNVKYILDLREFPDSPYGDRVVHDIETLIDDRDISVVCETMGGSHPAYEYSVALMRSGKSVVTSNKEVVASFGDELLRCAAENGVTYMFEASVGGGIPVIRPFTTSLAGDSIGKIDGILNGTTNYILTRMKESGCSFEEALSEAQTLGYAERNPTNDVDGIDSKRKIMILAALASGKLVDNDCAYAETMTKVSAADNKAAEKWGGAVKLVASAVIDHANDKLALYVCPQFVPFSCPLAHISDVYNGVMVNSPVTGDVMFYGRGAGRFPTAGAVVDDVCAILSGAAAAETTPVFEKTSRGAVPFAELKFEYYVRTRPESKSDALEFLNSTCGKVQVIDSEDSGVLEAIVGEANLDEIRHICDNIGAVESVIRVWKNA